MALHPVIRGNPPKPLIIGASSLSPAIAENPCICCEEPPQDCCSICQDNLIAAGFIIGTSGVEADIELTISGIQNGNNGICNCSDCADLNGTYAFPGPIGVGLICCSDLLAQVNLGLPCGGTTEDPSFFYGVNLRVGCGGGPSGPECQFGAFIGDAGGGCSNPPNFGQCSFLGFASFLMSDAASTAAMLSFCSGGAVTITPQAGLRTPNCMCRFSTTTAQVRLVAW